MFLNTGERKAIRKKITRKQNDLSIQLTLEICDSALFPITKSQIGKRLKYVIEHFSE